MSFFSLFFMSSEIPGNRLFPHFSEFQLTTPQVSSRLLTPSGVMPWALMPVVVIGRRVLRRCRVGSPVPTIRHVLISESGSPSGRCLAVLWCPTPHFSSPFTSLRFLSSGVILLSICRPGAVPPAGWRQRPPFQRRPPLTLGQVFAPTNSLR